MKKILLSLMTLILLGAGTQVFADNKSLQEDADRFAAQFVPVEGHYVKVIKKGDAKSELSKPTDSKGEALFKDLKPGTYSYGFADKQPYSIEIKAGGPNCILIKANGVPKLNIKTFKKDPKMGFDYTSIKATLAEAPKPLADGPIAGAKIKASKYPDEFYATTDKNGIAVFKDIKPGVYIFGYEDESKVLVLSKDKREDRNVRIKVSIEAGKVSITRDTGK